MKFALYDLETTGLSPAFDQPLQFAAILTDDAFREIERVNLRCRIAPHIIPSPWALAVTGVGPAQLLDPALPRLFEFTQQISTLIDRWSPDIWMRIALTSGLTRKRVADDLGVWMSTLNKWITAHGDTDVVSTEDLSLAQENDKLRRENRILKEERDTLKKATAQQTFADFEPTTAFGAYLYGQNWIKFLLWWQRACIDHNFSLAKQPSARPQRSLPSR
jgi:transposase-like protein